MFMNEASRLAKHQCKDQDGDDHSSPSPAKDRRGDDGTNNGRGDNVGAGVAFSSTSGVLLPKTSPGDCCNNYSSTESMHANNDAEEEQPSSHVNDRPMRTKSTGKIKNPDKVVDVDYSSLSRVIEERRGTERSNEEPSDNVGAGVAANSTLEMPSFFKEGVLLQTSSSGDYNSMKSTHTNYDREVKHREPCAEVEHGEPSAEIEQHPSSEFDTLKILLKEVELREPSEEVEHRKLSAAVEHGQPSAAVEHRELSAEVEHGQPFAEVEHGQPSAEVEHGQPSAEVEHGQPSAEEEHGQPSAEVEHGQPFAEVEHGQPSAEVEHGQPSAEVEHGQPSAEVEHGQPSAEVEHGQPSAEVEHGQHSAAVEHRELSAEVEHGQLSAEVEHGQPSAEVEDRESSAEVEHGQPSAEVEYGQPSAEVEHGQPSAEVEYGQPSAEVEHRESSAKVEHGQPSAEVEHGQPSAEVEHGQPSAEVEHGESSAEVEHGQPSAEVEHSESSAKVELGEPSADVEVREPSAEVESREPSADVEVREPSAEVEPREPSAEVEEREPSAEVESREPSADVEVREPSAEVEPREPPAEVEEREPSAEVESREPSADVEVREPSAEVEEGESPAGVEELPSPALDTWEILPKDCKGISVQETQEHDLDLQQCGNYRILKQERRVGFLEDSIAEEFNDSGQFRYTDGGQIGKGEFGKCFFVHTYPTIEQCILAKKIDNTDFEASEVNVMARLKHPNIARLFGVLQFNDHYRILMEYIDGMTLKVRIQQGLNVQKSLQYYRQILDALAYMHENGFIHCDIKSDNVMVRNNPDETVVIDFGNAEKHEDPDSDDYTEWTQDDVEEATTCFMECLGLAEIPDEPRGDISEEVINLLHRGFDAEPAAGLLNHPAFILFDPPPPFLGGMDLDRST